MGFEGYLMKILILAVMQGEAYLDSDVKNRVVGRMQKQSQPATYVYLTPREIVGLLCMGCKVSTIRALLDLAPCTNLV